MVGRRAVLKGVLSSGVLLTRPNSIRGQTNPEPTVSYGETTSVAVDDSSPTHLSGLPAEPVRFDGNPGDEVRIRFESENLRGMYYDVETPLGSSLFHHTVQWSASGGAAGYVDVLLHSGEHTIWVGPFPDTDAGRISLSVERVGTDHLLSLNQSISETLSAPDTDWGAIDSDIGLISIPTYLDLYAVRGRANQTVEATVSADGFVPKLLVTPRYTDSYTPVSAIGTDVPPRDEASLSHTFGTDGVLEIGVTAIADIVGEYTLTPALSGQSSSPDTHAPFVNVLSEQAVVRKQPSVTVEFVDDDSGIDLNRSFLRHYPANCDPVTDSVPECTPRRTVPFEALDSGAYRAQLDDIYDRVGTRIQYMIAAVDGRGNRRDLEGKHVEFVVTPRVYSTADAVVIDYGSGVQDNTSNDVLVFAVEEASNQLISRGAELAVRELGVRTNLVSNSLGLGSIAGRLVGLTIGVIQQAQLVGLPAHVDFTFLSSEPHQTELDDAPTISPGTPVFLVYQYAPGDRANPLTFGVQDPDTDEQITTVTLGAHSYLDAATGRNAIAVARKPLRIPAEETAQLRDGEAKDFRVVAKLETPSSASDDVLASKTLTVERVASPTP